MKRVRYIVGVMLLAGLMSGSLTAGKAEAAFSFIRSVDGWKESVIYSQLVEYRNYTESILESVNGLKSIASLKNLTSQFTGLSDLVNSYNSVLKIKDDVVNTVSGTMSSYSSIQSALSSAGMSGSDLTGVLNSAIQFTRNGNGSLTATKTSDAVVSSALNDGDYSAASGTVVYNLREVLEKNLGLDKTTSTASDSKQKAAEEATKSALKVAVDVAPMSFPGAQSAAAEIAGSSKASPATKYMYATGIADSARDGAIEQISKVIAPYTAPVDSEGSYRKTIKELDEQSKKALEKTAELSGGGPSAAMRTIASISAVLVEQTALQNRYLVKLTDAVADNIKIQGINALLSVEGYSQGVRTNTQNFIDNANAMDR